MLRNELLGRYSFLRYPFKLPKYKKFERSMIILLLRLSQCRCSKLMVFNFQCLLDISTIGLYLQEMKCYLSVTFVFIMSFYIFYIMLP